METMTKEEMIEYMKTATNVLSGKFGIHPMQAFVYGYSKKMKSADYAQCTFFNYEDNVDSLFDGASAYVSSSTNPGGWTIELGSGTGQKRNGHGSRIFVGIDDGRRCIQFYNTTNRALLAKVKKALVSEFGGKRIEVMAFE